MVNADGGVKSPGRFPNTPGEAIDHCGPFDSGQVAKEERKAA
jgi:hypothetical protein